MTTRVQKWGNSLALRIPKSFAQEIKLDQGTEVELSLENGKLFIRRVEDENPYTLEGLLAGITDENIHEEIDTEPPVDPEVC
jgi:antitoxin MazE